MNTPAFTNLLGVRVRGRRRAMSPDEVVTYEGVVMAVSFGEFPIDRSFGATASYTTRPACPAVGFVLLICDDEHRIFTVAVDTSIEGTHVIPC